MERVSQVLRKLRRPLPVWALLVAILVTASAAAGSYLVFTQLGSKPDFNMRANPPSVPVLVFPNEAVFKINVSSLNTFSGVVTLDSKPPPGVNATVSTQVGNRVVFLGKSDTATVTAFAKAVGNYTIRVTGTSGTISHSIDLSLVVQSISMSFNPNPAVVFRYPANATITVTGQNGFSGNVSMLTSDYYPGYYTSPFPNPVYVPRGGMATTKISISDLPNSVPGRLHSYATTPQMLTPVYFGNGYYSMQAQSIDLCCLQVEGNESIALANYSFTSSTNVTLNLMNNSDFSASLLSYSVSDGTGDSYIMNYTVQPSINCCSMTPLAIVIGTSCPSCSLTGTAFAFTKGHSYTIAIEWPNSFSTPYHVYRAPFTIVR